MYNLGSHKTKLVAIKCHLNFNAFEFETRRDRCAVVPRTKHIEVEVIRIVHIRFVSLHDVCTLTSCRTLRFGPLVSSGQTICHLPSRRGTLRHSWLVTIQETKSPPRTTLATSSCEEYVWKRVLNQFNPPDTNSKTRRSYTWDAYEDRPSRQQIWWDIVISGSSTNPDLDEI